MMHRQNGKETSQEGRHEGAKRKTVATKRFRAVNAHEGRPLAARQASMAAPARRAGIR